MTKIRVNVYDLHTINSLLRCIKLGIYHSSVVINDVREYFFGFADFGYTGIDSPYEIDKIPSTMIGERYNTYEMGNSSYTFEECLDIVKLFKKSERYLSDHYNVLFHNCNTFTYELCIALLGEENMGNFPFWIKRGQEFFGFLFRISMSYTIGLARKPMGPLGTEPTKKQVIEKPQIDTQKQKREMDVMSEEDDVEEVDV